MKQITCYSKIALVTIIIFTVLGTTLAVRASSTSISTSNNDPNDSSILLPGGVNSEQDDFWEIDEFKNWMEQERVKNQKLADSKDNSFYVKDVNGNYSSREWTQNDVDNLYAEWKTQLDLMKKGYHFTKPVSLADGGVLAGAFDPQTWNSNSTTVQGTATITLPDGSIVDLGHFNTQYEASKAIEAFLKKKVADGKLTQQEADTIFNNNKLN